MQSTTGEIDAMNKNHHTSDEEEFDPENQKMFESQVIEERDILVESNDFNSSTMESEDPKEKAVNHIRGLFKKLKLLTEVDDYKKILDYYYNGEERNEQLYETLIAKEKELEEEAIKAREFEEILKDLRKKEKTNQDHIKEDIEGYQLSKKVVNEYERLEYFHTREQKIDEDILLIGDYIDDIRARIAENVDEFWQKRIEKIKEQNNNLQQDNNTQQGTLLDVSNHADVGDTKSDDNIIDKDKPSDQKKDDQKKDDKLADDKPSDQKKDDKLADDKPVDDKPSDQKKDDKPVDQKSVDDKPVDQKKDDKPVGDKIAGDKPLDEKPIDEKPIDEKPVDQEPVDQEPVDQEPVDQEPVDQEPVDNKPVGDKISGDRPLDERLTNSNPADNRKSDGKQSPQIQNSGGKSTNQKKSDDDHDTQKDEQKDKDAIANQSRLDNIKKEEYKADIYEFRIDDSGDNQDPLLANLNEKLEEYQPTNQKIMNKMRWLEKLSEDVNLLTNFLRNKKLNISQISMLKKQQPKEALDFKVVEKDIYNISYDYYEKHDLKKTDELITKDLNKLKDITKEEVVARLKQNEKDKKTAKENKIIGGLSGVEFIN